jgi:hypothetical protein
MDLIILLAALAITFLVFTWLVRVVRVTLRVAIVIAILVLLFQLFFGIGPDAIWQQIRALFNWFVGLLG